MGAAYHLPRLVGLGRATELLILGGDVDPARATAIGARDPRRPGRRAGDDPGAGATAGRRPRARHDDKILLGLDLDLGGAIEMEALAQALAEERRLRRVLRGLVGGRSPAWTGR